MQFGPLAATLATELVKGGEAELTANAATHTHNTQNAQNSSDDALTKTHNITHAFKITQTLEGTMHTSDDTEERSYVEVKQSKEKKRSCFSGCFGRGKGKLG